MDNIAKYIDPMVDWSFKRIFDVAEFAGLDDDDKKKYVKDMNTERDTYNQIAYAREEGLQKGLQTGLQKGREEEKLGIARRMLAKGTDADTVAEITELDIDTVRKLMPKSGSESGLHI